MKLVGVIFICCALTAGAAPLAAAQQGQSDEPAQQKMMGGQMPMMADTGAMQKNMSAMMADMSAMMSSTGDPSMKARMQKMHDQMAAMMVNMQEMNGRMGGMMNQGGQMPMMGMMNQGGMMPMMGAMMMPMMGVADHIEGRLAFLKTELKITDVQLPQWSTFADVVRASATQMNDMMKQGSTLMMTGGSQSTLPQRLDLAEKHMSAHLEMLRKMKAALLPLYASFSDEQKRSADALFHGPMGI